MIKQICTFYEDTYKIKSYSEFFDSRLIVYAVYDKDNNKIYFETNYIGQERFWFKKQFAQGVKNENGPVEVYEDSNGVFKTQYFKGRKIYNIDKKKVINTFYDGSKIIKDVINIDVSVGGSVGKPKLLFSLQASKREEEINYYADFYNEKNDKLTLEYYPSRFNEIYYHDFTLPNRVIIHVDEANKITEYKDVIDEYNIILCSRNYRIESRDFRKFIPRYF